MSVKKLEISAAEFKTHCLQLMNEVQARRVRILLSKPVNQWIDEALTAPGLELAPLSAAVAIESCGLPGVIHADPADRLIIATARIEGALLMGL